MFGSFALSSKAHRLDRKETPPPDQGQCVRNSEPSQTQRAMVDVHNTRQDTCITLLGILPEEIRLDHQPQPKTRQIG